MIRNISQFPVWLCCLSLPVCGGHRGAEVHLPGHRLSGALLTADTQANARTAQPRGHVGCSRTGTAWRRDVGQGREPRPASDTQLNQSQRSPSISTTGISVARGATYEISQMVPLFFPPILFPTPFFFVEIFDVKSQE